MPRVLWPQPEGNYTSLPLLLQGPALQCVRQEAQVHALQGPRSLLTFPGLQRPGLADVGTDLTMLELLGPQLT